MRNFLDGLETKLSNEFKENRLLLLRSESFDSVALMVNFKESLKTSFTDMLGFLVSLLSFDGNNKTADSVARLISSTEKKIIHMNFFLYGETAVPCPDGFKENFSGYVTSLNEERDIIIKQALDSLEEFNTYLASFIGNKDSKISLKDDKEKYLKLKKCREAQTLKFESYFTSGVNQRQYLNKMFATKVDIVDTAKEAVNLWRHVKVLHPRDIEAKCKIISQRIQQVIDISNGKNNSAVSKQALLNIVDGSYEVARQVEHLGLFMARSETASVTVGNIFEVINKILK